MLRAITHKVSPRIDQCQLTFLDRSPIDFQLATRQHDDYCALLERLGVFVTRLCENEEFPDSCFVEDTAIVVDELAVICSMGAPSRRGETRLIERELAKYRCIARVSLPATIDGGDALRVGQTIYVGQSSRTNRQGIEELSQILEPIGYRVVSVLTKRGLHLKSACTAINDHTLLVNPHGLDLEPFKKYKLLPTPPSEPDAANVLRLGSTVCVQASFPLTAGLVKPLVGRLEIIDMSELRKAEAGLSCSSIVFES